MGGRGGQGGDAWKCSHANDPSKQTECLFQADAEGERERERAEQDGCHLLIYSWAQPYRDVAGGCTVDVHKGLEAKCGKYNIDLECIWKVF